MIDNEIFEIMTRSIMISGTATIFASTWSIPLSFYLSSRYSRTGSIVMSFFNALVGVPTVVVGLFLYMLFSKSGPLGFIGILYTPQAIILGEAILITPLLVSLLYETFYRTKEKYWELALTLGASESQALVLFLIQALPEIVIVLLLGFSRAIGELGVALLVGGNIKGYTRVATTAISLEVVKGEFEKALLLGAFLVTTVLAISISIRLLKKRLE